MTQGSPDITITHHVQGQGGRYVAVVADAMEEGFLEWEPAAQLRGQPVRIAAHTIVPRAIGGRGVAAALVDRLVEDARRQGFLIRPDCFYVAKRFGQHPEWEDVRA